jgi:hypothetical protein
VDVLTDRRIGESNPEIEKFMQILDETSLGFILISKLRIIEIQFNKFNLKLCSR